MNPKDMTLYWGAPLFTQAEREWNKACVAYLRNTFGYPIIVPQDEARKFIGRNGLDFDALSLECCKHTVSSTVGLFTLDGADSDSGTSVEAGVKVRDIQLRSFGYAIGIRTDLRKVSEDPLTQVNGMFRRLDAIVTYFEEDIAGLCQAIHEKIQALTKEKPERLVLV